MPFPANWLEELVIEWLDLDGFVISTSVSVNAPEGGRVSPDVVGAKVNTNGRLVIRHCEAAMHLDGGPEKIGERYAKTKFSRQVEQEVRGHFARIFGAQKQEPVYEKWIITFRLRSHVEDALRERIKEIRIHPLDDFVLNEVLSAIKRWRETHTETTQLPGDKWLLHLIDRFKHFGLIPGQKALPKRAGTKEAA